MAGATAREDTPARLRIRVRGAVQGVGFRPFAYAIAARFSLSGFVRNDGDGVLLEIEGARHADFLDALRREMPPLASIDSIDVERIRACGDGAFSILESAGGETHTRMVADAATCDACLDELFEPRSRFHLYPFITCTDCGPRFTIVSSLPYDRSRTSMAPFAMCEDCARDYRDPRSRRFHAQTIACPSCGPRLEHAPATIVASIRAGKIVALKGIGGYHLMCDARNEAAVAELRRRKARDAKPLAIMAANVASIRRFAEPSGDELDLLTQRARPVVIVRSSGALAPSVAPRLNRIGVMLPYAPLHHLLFHAAATSPCGPAAREAANDFVVVATSANPGGEPLVADDDDARRRLSTIADLIVGHDRGIVARADDSVMAVIDGAPTFLRRSRGFIPEPIDLGVDGPSVIAVGAHLKSSVTVTRNREAFVSRHVGDLDNPESLRFFDETVRHLLSFLDVRPEFAACDLHPDFYASRFAQEMDLPLMRVQHHAAHVAAVAAEHGFVDSFLGVALDGYGMGDDHGSWGGELLLVEGARWKRIGHLSPLALPGGDRAAREPWRMGLAALAAIGRLDVAQRLFPDAPLAGRAVERLKRGQSPQTTSMGRLFDAAAALANVCLEQRYEGQAAMEFEALVETPGGIPEAFRLSEGVLDFAPVLSFIATERPGPRMAADVFHGALIEGCAAWIDAAAKAHGKTRVALGGGCMMNHVLAKGLADALRAKDLSPFMARAAPCNDGGISLGQAALARAAFATDVNDKERVVCA